MKRALSLLTLALLVGCRGETHDLGLRAGEPAPPAPCCAPAAATCCTPGDLAECLAPGECGTEDVICQPGPDCFAPEICADEAVPCPADVGSE